MVHSFLDDERFSSKNESMTSYSKFVIFQIHVNDSRTFLSAYIKVLKRDLIVGTLWLNAVKGRIKINNDDLCLESNSQNEPFFVD